MVLLGLCWSVDVAVVVWLFVIDVKDKDVGNPELSPLTLTETLAQNILLMRCLECVAFCFAKVRRAKGILSNI